MIAVLDGSFTTGTSTLNNAEGWHRATPFSGGKVGV